IASARSIDWFAKSEITLCGSRLAFVWRARRLPIRLMFYCLCVEIRGLARVHMRTALAIPTVLFASGCLGAAGCNPAEKKGEAHPSQAKVDKGQQETELNKIVLKPEAEERLGLKWAEVEEKQVSRVRNYGGEIALPPGASLVIGAPVS